MVRKRYSAPSEECLGTGIRGIFITVKEKRKRSHVGHEEKEVTRSRANGKVQRHVLRVCASQATVRQHGSS